MGRFLDFEGVDAVVFDCDGVILDSEPLSERAWRETLDEFGVELGESFDRWVGTTDRAIADHYADTADATPDQLLDRNAAILVDMVEREGVSVFDDTMRAIERVQTTGVRTAVATNSERWRLEALLAAAGLLDRFDTTVSSDDVIDPKPAPDVYVRVAELLDVEPGRVLVVEDSPAGVAAARAAGMRVVAVDRGVFAAADLAPATRIVPTLPD